MVLCREVVRSHSLLPLRGRATLGDCVAIGVSLNRSIEVRCERDIVLDERLDGREEGQSPLGIDACSLGVSNDGDLLRPRPGSEDPHGLRDVDGRDLDVDLTAAGEVDPADVVSLSSGREKLLGEGTVNSVAGEVVERWNSRSRVRYPTTRDP